MQLSAAALALLLTQSCRALIMSSLGSSFAAGPGLPTGSSYAHLAAKQLNASLTDLSVSGSTLVTMRPRIATQLPRDSDIVTITSGGNDVGYIAGLTMESWSSSLSIAFNPTLTHAQLLLRFNENLAMVHARAPKATIYLVEYLTLLGPDVKPNVNVPFNAARVQHHRGVAALLLAATKQAAEGKPWVRLVSVAEQSIGHGVGSANPWVNSNNVGSDGGIAWHPNRSGMRAVAQMLQDAIKNSTAST